MPEYLVAQNRPDQYVVTHSDDDELKIVGQNEVSKYRDTFRGGTNAKDRRDSSSGGDLSSNQDAHEAGHDGPHDKKELELIATWYSDNWGNVR
jgi:hypothetical protein